MSASTASEDAKAIVRRNTEEVQGGGDFALFDELFADDFVDHTPQPNMVPNKEGVRGLYSGLRSAFPDFHPVIHWQAVEGDLVTTYKTYHGTHQGEFLGIAPTGRRVSFEAVDAMRVRNGKIVEHWGVANLFSLIGQFGASMKRLLPIALAASFAAPAHAQSPNEAKRDALLWYEAFDQNKPALLDQILAPTWVDIPSPRGAVGPVAARASLTRLRTTFPDFRITVEDVIQEGDKVVVRSTITGTQRTEFMGMPARDRSMRIQAVDIHQFQDGKIIRTWHTEDWMTGLRELGAFER